LACGANFPGEAKRDVFLQMTLKTKVSGTLFRKTPHAFERKQIEIRNISLNSVQATKVISRNMRLHFTALSAFLGLTHDERSTKGNFFCYNSPKLLAQP